MELRMTQSVNFALVCYKLPFPPLKHAWIPTCACPFSLDLYFCMRNLSGPPCGTTIEWNLTQPRVAASWNVSQSLIIMSLSKL